jgi:hypothetical protein
MKGETAVQGRGAALKRSKTFISSLNAAQTCRPVDNPASSLRLKCRVVRRERVDSLAVTPP